MESFLELFEKRKISLSLQKLNKQDALVRKELKYIIDNQDIFKNFYSLFPLTDIATIDDYYLYLFTLKFDGMREFSSNINKEEDKEFIIHLANNAHQAFLLVDKGKIIKFINEHIRDIFNPNGVYSDTWFVTLGIVAKYITGINLEVIEYLVKDYDYLVIDNYGQFEKVIEKKPYLFDILFSDDHAENLYTIYQKEALEIWRHIIQKKKSNLKDLVIDRVEKMSDIIESMNAYATFDDIYMVEKITTEFYKFLQSIKSKKANEFKKYSESSKKLLNEKIKQQGQKIEYNIPASEMLTLWKKIENWQARLIRITHSIQQNNNTVSIDSQLSFNHTEKHPIIDDASTNIPHDDFFTFSHQQELSILEAIYSSLLHTIIFDIDALNDYLNCLLSAFIFIAEKMDIDQEQYRQDIDMLSELLLSISQCMKEADIPIHGLCYGTSMYICTLAEKLLRDFYLYLSKNEIYTPSNKVTLGELLSIGNSYIVSVFGENHVKHLSFFLQKIPNSDIGHNYRNSLAHWIDFEVQDMKPDFVAKTLWLLTDILNTIFVNFLEFKTE